MDSPTEQNSPEKPVGQPSVGHLARLHQALGADQGLRISLGIVAFFFLFALLTRILLRPATIFPYLLMDFGLLSLIYFIFSLTKQRPTPEPTLNNPLLQLALAFMIAQLLRIIPEIPLPHWRMGFIIRKNLIMALPVLIVILAFWRGQPRPRPAWRTVKADMGLGLIVVAFMALPGMFYSGSIRVLTAGQLSLWQLFLTLLVGFSLNLFSAAIPEELYYRAQIQRRLSEGLRSPWSALLISTLFFGLTHATDNTSWGFGSSLLDGLAEAVFVQTFIGLVLGTLYMRTRNIFLCIGVHAALNTITNIAFYANRLGFIS